MERAVSEVFDFNSVMLQVKDIVGKACCDGCYFDESELKCLDARNCTGSCHRPLRSDGKDVVFVEVKDDQIRRISNE